MAEFLRLALFPKPILGPDFASRNMFLEALGWAQNPLTFGSWGFAPPPGTKRKSSQRYNCGP